MRQEIHITLKLNLSKISIMLIFISLLMNSCSIKQDYLKNIIYNTESYCDDVILPMMISAPDSIPILICTTKNSILHELEKTNDKNKAKEILYSHIQSKSPINVSTKYYMICKDDCVFMTQDVYKKFKEFNKEDFIKHYFKNINGIFVIYESAEMFPTKGKEPYKGFGHDTNVKLISYLLSIYNIYLQYVWLDEDCISRIAIAEKVSNMSTVNNRGNF